MRRGGRSVVSVVLLLVGAALLLVGGVLLYPYVRSRLATVTLPAPGPTPTYQFIPLIEPSAGSPDLPGGTLPPRPTHAAAPISPISPVATPAPAPPTRLVIETLGVDAPVVAVSLEQAEVAGQEVWAWDVPDEYAAGWHESSASLGVSGNTVLNGHNTTGGEVFRDLYTLEEGAIVAVYSGDVLYRYRVAAVLVLPEAGQPMSVRLENARYIGPTSDERLTLVTCHPYGSVRNRLVVVAFPLE